MKFKRNQKDALFSGITVILLFATTIMSITLLAFGYHQNLLRITLFSLFIGIPFFLVTRDLESNYIEFTESDIYLIGRNTLFDIKTKYIVKIYLPSKGRQKNNFKSKNIYIYSESFEFIVSYSKEIYDYFDQNYQKYIGYYDKRNFHLFKKKKILD